MILLSISNTGDIDNNDTNAPETITVILVVIAIIITNIVTCPSRCYQAGCVLTQCENVIMSHALAVSSRAGAEELTKCHCTSWLRMQ